MKLKLKAVTAAIIIFALNGGDANAAPGDVPRGTAPFLFMFDEFGNGSISADGVIFQPLRGLFVSNPSNVGLPFEMALTYLLPVPVEAGDVAIGGGSDDPVPLAGVRSDGLRFTNAAGALVGPSVADRMIYYSDNTDADEVPFLADTGFPTNFTAPVTVLEIGLEANAQNSLQGFNYQNASQPIYNGISDQLVEVSVPEPASLAILGMSLAGFGLIGVCRRRKRM